MDNALGDHNYCTMADHINKKAVFNQSNKLDVLTAKTPESIKNQMRIEHDLLTNNMSEAKQYLADTVYQMELTPLYSIHCATNFAYFEKYCAIILKLGSEMLKKVGSGIQYLLTVWERGGKKLYSEYLEEIPYCWNTSGSKIIYMKDLRTVSIIDCENLSAPHEFHLHRTLNLPAPYLNSHPPRLIGLSGKHLIIIEPEDGDN